MFDCRPKYKIFVIIPILLFIKTTVFSNDVLFISELPTPGEFTLFANGGWNGNWYVGYDHGWITQLPAQETSSFKKAFLGAKLGRAKTARQIQGIKGIDEIYPCRIMIGISGSVDALEEQYILTTIDKIPLEGSKDSALNNVSDSMWFWVEIDINLIKSDMNNYIHLWSDDENLDSAEVAPILAAGIGSNEKENSYLIKGRAGSKEIKIIKYFEPAIAIKLVGSSAPEPKVWIKSIEDHPLHEQKQIFEIDVFGRYITEVGLEINDGVGWKKTGNIIMHPPFFYVFDFSKLSDGKYEIRSWAKNWWEKEAYSKPKIFSIGQK